MKKISSHKLLFILNSCIIFSLYGSEIDNFNEHLKNQNWDSVNEAYESNHDIINEFNTQKVTPLMLQIIEDNTEAVRYLISKNVDINQKNSFGNSALFWGCIYNRPEALEALFLSDKVIHSINEKNHVDSTPFVLTFYQNSKNALSILTTHKKDEMDLTKKYYFPTPLYLKRVLNNQQTFVDYKLNELYSTIYTSYGDLLPMHHLTVIEYCLLEEKFDLLQSFLSNYFSHEDDIEAIETTIQNIKNTALNNPLLDNNEKYKEFINNLAFNF